MQIRTRSASKRKLEQAAEVVTQPDASREQAFLPVALAGAFAF